MIDHLSICPKINLLAGSLGGFQQPRVDQLSNESFRQY